MEKKKCEKCNNYDNGVKSCKKGLPLNHKGNCTMFKRKSKTFNNH